MIPHKNITQLFLVKSPTEDVITTLTRAEGLVPGQVGKTSGGNWVYASKEGAFISGWHYISNDIFYFDTEDPTPHSFGEVVLNRPSLTLTSTAPCTGQMGKTSRWQLGLCLKRKVPLSQGGTISVATKIFYFDTEDPTHPALFGEVV